ncbi:MAG: energy-coupling factor ABC transporter permease [Gemmatimonadetes bacterium]|nr:energy-coupling factor ABC transporter permease [Gemmatimonadota bacterium]
MHLAEGILPAAHALGWTAAALPWLADSVRAVRRLVRGSAEHRALLGVAGGFAFLLSAIKLPSFTGSSSHPVGTALGTALLGPRIMPVMGAIVLLFQALFLAHGGLTTLGANLMSYGIIGPWVAAGVLQVSRRVGANDRLGLFLAAVIGGCSTYLVAALQMAMAYPGPTGGIGGAWVRFLAVYGVTQMPLAVVEGFFTVAVYRSIAERLAVPAAAR